MSDTSRMYDLLAEWEELRQKGISATAEQLCPDDAALQAELSRRIQRQERMRAMIDPPTPIDAPRPTMPSVEGYRLIDVIGNGGMGIVYRAQHQSLNRVVALKMILSGDSNREQLARFRDEALAVAALQHPHIVQVFDTGETEGRPYLALEYLPGGSLADRLGGTPVEPRRAADLVGVIAGAVQHAHERGIVHRDLKPANVLLDLDGTPKVSDFGLAKRLDNDSGRTRTGAILGSPSYMPPEQATGQSQTIGPGADVYALGAILYELLTGRPPFLGKSVLETIRQVSEHPPVEPRALQPGVPRDLEVICLKCLEKRPEDRYESAAALSRDLNAFLAGEPIQARPVSVLEQLSRNLRRGNFDPKFRIYAQVLLALAPWPLLIHLAVYFGFRHHPHFPVIVTAVSLAVIVCLQCVMHYIILTRATLQGVPPGQRRHFLTVWSAELVGSVILWFLVWSVVPGDRLETMFLVYPLWVHQLGNTYLAFASEAGGLYVQGVLLLFLSVAFAFILPWMPLVVGGLMFVNMTLSGLFLFRGIGTIKQP
jgi:serine/threonine protein kinase